MAVRKIITIAESIDQVIHSDLATRLKEAGFRKAGRTFYAQAADHTQVVNVQADKWNQGQEGRFTINLGVYLPAVARLSEAPPITGKHPKEYDCTLRERLPVLMHGGRDIWWEIAPSTDLGSVATKVGTAWSVFGKPWLAKMSTLEGALEGVLKQYAYFPAANICLLLGRKNEATNLLKTALERSPRAAARLNAWGQKNGLLEAAI